MAKNIEDVKDFWEKNPLFLGESIYPFSSEEFFKEHNSIYVQDCFAGRLDERLIPNIKKNSRILDAGCGIGFWTETFLKNGFTNLFACDITDVAVSATTARIKSITNNATITKQNIEQLNFNNEYFDWVNCQGVLHHTPNPYEAIKEFHRVLKPKGELVFSVYHKSIFLRFSFYILRLLPKSLKRLISLPGRGREKMLYSKNLNEFIRSYDGIENPIGIGFTKSEIIDLLDSRFEIKYIYKHYLPIRKFPLKVPKYLHRILDRTLGLMIFVNCSKK